MKMILRIRDLREDHDKKQREIAKILFVARNTYSSYERGLRVLSLELAVKLAVYYDISLDYLVGLTDIPTPPPRKK